jgi:hypothetical protein
MNTADAMKHPWDNMVIETIWKSVSVGQIRYLNALAPSFKYHFNLLVAMLG